MLILVEFNVYLDLFIVWHFPIENSIIKRIIILFISQVEKVISNKTLKYKNILKY